MTVWVVRAREMGTEEQIALERNVVVIGWDELPDLTSVQGKEELRDLYEEQNPDSAPETVAQVVSCVWAFRSEIKEGDLVVLPLKSDPDSLAIGRVVSPYRYRADMPRDAHHAHAVEWLNKRVPRSAFGDDLLRSFNVPATVSRVGAENAEERLNAVLQGEKDPGPGTGSEVSGFDRESEASARSAFENMYANRAARLAALRILASSIGHAHAAGPRSWQLRLDPGLFRLTVGRVWAVEGHGGQTLILVDDRYLDSAARAQIAARGKIEPSALKSLKSPYVVTFENRQLEGILEAPFYPALQEAHFRTIDEVRSKFPFGRFTSAHSLGLLKYMRTELGEEIPDPEYAVAPTQPIQRNVWLFQGNPSKYDLEGELSRMKPGDEDEWYVSRYGDQMRSGDIALIWRSGPQAGLYAIGELTGEAYQKPVSAWRADDAKPGSIETDVSFRYTHILQDPIPRARFLEHPRLKEMQVLKQPQGTNFRVTQDEWNAIQALIGPVEAPQPERYAEPPFDAILESVQSQGLRIDERTLRRYHISLKVRGFVILSGISGTGKTWLGEAYASAVGAECLVVAVAPNWMTNEDLLGYQNPIDGNYYNTDFSLFIRKASKEYAQALLENRRPKPFHLVLDEMNLARVEYYFAKFLSAMEERARGGVARIMLAEDDPVLLAPNLVFVGTVNVDETTHGFADKVYDRAQLIELSAPREALRLHIGTQPYRDILMQIWDAVCEVAPFAFRVVDDVSSYVDQVETLGGSWKDALDEQILQKVLPKLSKADSRIAGALQRCVQIATENDLPLTRDKAAAMQARLEEYGFASYF